MPLRSAGDGGGRGRMRRGKSRRLFSKTARGAHPANFMAVPMRGGFRI